MKEPTNLNPGAAYQLRAIWTFAKRELRIWAYFRWSFVFDHIAVVTNFLIYLVIASQSQSGAQTSTYGLDYASFVVVGLVLNTLMAAALTAPYSGLMSSWWDNRIETLMMSPVSLPTFITGVSSGVYVRALFQIAIYFIVGFFFVRGTPGPSPDAFDGLGILGFALLALLSCTGLGLISASMIYIADARGGSDPVRMVVEVITGVASGVYVPVVGLPPLLQWVACCLPQVYVLDGVRRLLSPLPVTVQVHSLPIHSVFPSCPPIMLNVFALLASSLIWGLLGIRLVKHGFELARHDGRLSKWR